jgi:hypothetical protein
MQNPPYSNRHNHMPANTSELEKRLWEPPMNFGPPRCARTADRSEAHKNYEAQIIYKALDFESLILSYCFCSRKQKGPVAFVELTGLRRLSASVDVELYPLCPIVSFRSIQI